MDSYIDISVRSDPNFPVHQLLSVLFKKLHSALIQINSRDIGVSFPEYQIDSVGTALRLHGSADALTKVMNQNWLTGMHDHIKIAQLRSVPPGTKHRTVQRIQAKSSPDRLRRRAIRRHGLTADAAVTQIPDSAAETLKLPYIKLVSSSTGRYFPLFVRHGLLQDEPVEGPFSSYGFSGKTTIPWF